MKNIIFCMLFVFLINNLFCQIESQKNLFAVNYGFVDISGYQGKRIGPLGIRMEKRINDRIALGFDLSFAKSDYDSSYITYSYQDSKVVSNHHYLYTNTIRIDIMPTFQFYFIKSKSVEKKIDCFSILGIGYRDLNINSNMELKGKSFTLQEYPICYKIGIGVNLFLSKNFGVNSLFTFSNSDIIRFGVFHTFY